MFHTVPPGSSLRTVGQTYAVIPAGDVEMLFEALTEAAELDNEQSGIPYKIYLAAGGYQLGETLVVFGTVEIYGAGMATTTLRQTGLPGPQAGSMNTMIKLPGKSLKLDHITITDGRTDANGGGINVENSSATLTITNVKFLNNSSANSLGGGDGGAILTAEPLRSTKSISRAIPPSAAARSLIYPPIRVSQFTPITSIFGRTTVP